MNHPTTIREVLLNYKNTDNKPRPHISDLKKWKEVYEENKAKAIETALQDITRIIEEALPDEVVHIDEDTGIVTAKVNPYRDSLKKVIGE